MNQTQINTVVDNMANSQINMAIDQMSDAQLSAVANEIPESVIKDSVNQMSNSQIQAIVDGMSDEQINAIKPEVYEEVKTMAMSYNDTQVPIYSYKVKDGGTVKDQGYFVGGKIGEMLMDIKGSSVIVSGSSLTQEIKDKLLAIVKNNIENIIQWSGIDKVVDKVTDAVDDLSDSIDDLADSLKDKSDDVGMVLGVLVL